MDEIMTALRALHSGATEADLNANIDCTLIDPVALINPYFASTYSLISDLSIQASDANRAKADLLGVDAWNAADIAFSLTFMVEACFGIYSVAQGCVSGGFGFAVDLHGEAVVYGFHATNLGVEMSFTKGVGSTPVDAGCAVSFGLVPNIGSVIGETY